MSLDAIPIHVVNPTPGESALTGNAPPLLRELAEQVRRLLETGEPSAIDLSALPLTPADLDWLRDRLGSGEIAVTLQANGESTLNETACPGVWWVTHHNEQGAVTSQFIEVAFVPELVKAHPQDVAIGLEQLELSLSGL
ncbi:MAG: hydrogenase expression/formation protein [Thiobacillus sp. 65-1059]|nr:MAG: hydrogenase expression/formation protein [Thiobacillus sp. 65-1059]